MPAWLKNLPVPASPRTPPTVTLPWMLPDTDGERNAEDALEQELEWDEFDAALVAALREE